jgi:hypothetical protein
MESSYRGHQDDWCAKIVNYIAKIGTKGLRFDNYPAEVIKADMVLHGGDVSDQWGNWKESTFLDPNNWEEEMDDIWKQLYDAGIPFLSISGNHDAIGESRIAAAKKFVSNTFEDTKSGHPNDFQYTKIGSDFTMESDFFTASYRGLQIATVDDSLKTKVIDQWSTFKSNLDTSKPTLFFSHRPLSVQRDEEDDRLTQFIDSFPVGTAHFSGHTHKEAKNPIISSSPLKDYTAPYPHYYHDGELPGFLAVLVSPVDGILEVKSLDIPYQEVTWCLEKGTHCLLGTSCENCCPNQESTYWAGKLFTACGVEPCWGDNTVCLPGTTCNNCCNTALNALGFQCGGSCYSDGTVCGIGTTCNGCCSGDYEWWDSKFLTACGSEPGWGTGSVCGYGTTCGNCLAAPRCEWYWFGVCKCG